MIKKRPLVKAAPKKVLKKFTKFRTIVLSRHPSHKPLRTLLALLPFRSVIRLGSTTPWADDKTHGGARVECNTVQGVKNSASKRLMKEAFKKGGVITADWCTGWSVQAIKTGLNMKEWSPVVAKHIHGSRGTGNYLLKTEAELQAWFAGKTENNYIFEKFYDYSREYRIHVSRNGAFYTCRKMLKSDTPEANRWYRNDSNSTWVLETNPAFDKPSNWAAIVSESVKALSSVGLDVGAIDVKVQSAKDSKGAVRKEPKFIILETNSAPSFGEVTLQKYLEEIPRILKAKYVD